MYFFEQWNANIFVLLLIEVYSFIDCPYNIVIVIYLFLSKCVVEIVNLKKISQMLSVKSISKFCLYTGKVLIYSCLRNFIKDAILSRNIGKFS